MKIPQNAFVPPDSVLLAQYEYDFYIDAIGVHNVLKNSIEISREVCRDAWSSIGKSTRRFRERYAFFLTEDQLCLIVVRPYDKTKSGWIVVNFVKVPEEIVGALLTRPHTELTEGSRDLHTDF